MKKNLFTLFSLLFLAKISLAQMTIKGTLVDSTQKPLVSATVMLFDSKDSSLVSFTRSLDKGNFEFKNVRTKPYFVKITFVGLQPYQKPVPSLDGLVLDLGQIVLLPIPKELSEVVVKGERAPVTIKKDTIEYNAGSFKTQPNAVVEDLLKKLPGVEVERDGTVKAMGEKVQRVLVDGKEFFGRDPKIATKNLPADAVDKVQVFDKKSDMAEFSGIDDGQRAKTINLALKDDHKKMTFGSLMAGAGTPEGRFSTKANLNYFNKARHLSFIGTGNNINQQGFSIEDYLNFSGDMMRMQSGRGGMVRMSFNLSDDNPIPFNTGQRQNGFMNSWSAGLNLNDQLTKKSELNGSYFYNYLNQQTERETNRENILPAGSQFAAQNTLQDNRNTNQRLNFTVDTKVDSMNTLRWTNYINHTQSNIVTNSAGNTLNAQQQLLNSNRRENSNNSTVLTVNSNLLWRHKFAKKGRTLTSNLTLNINNDDRTGNLNARNFFYEGKAIMRIDTISQNNVQMGQRANYGVNFSFTEPIAKRKYLEANYAYQLNRSDVVRDVFDLHRGERIFNTQLSNNFQIDFDYQRVGANFRIVEPKYNLSAGLAYQRSGLEGTLPLKNVAISRTFENWLPNVRFNYDFSNSKRIGINYDTDVQQPNVNQLAPVIDNGDPLNVYEGNPNLRPELNHSVGVNFNTFSAFDFTSFFVFLNARYTQDKIKDAQNIDNIGRRYIKPVNVDNELTLMANVSLGFRIKPINGRVNVGPSMTYSRGLGPVNGILNTTEMRVLRAKLNYEYRPREGVLKEVLELSAGVDVSHNQTLYSLNKSANQSYYNQTYTGEAVLNLPKNWNFRTDLDYIIYNFGGSGFEQRLPLWNASLAKSFLKNKRGELKFSVVDLLNKNVGIQRTAQQNFVQGERIRSLARYFLLTFTYSLKNGKTQSNMRIITG